MASGGLQRRRVNASSSNADTSLSTSDQPGSRSASNAPSASKEISSNSSLEYDGVTGHKVAYDPQDVREGVERSKQPRLTIMEEILLLGLKDKQVCFRDYLIGHCIDKLRAISLFGTITSLIHFAAASF